MTTLLTEVITGASTDAPLGGLLRRVKVLAARTGAPALESWVEHELNGYPETVEVPAYRGPVQMRPLGHFIGMFGAEARNVEIPTLSFPSDYRDGGLFKMLFGQPIATIEAWAGDSSGATFGWPADAVQLYNHMVAEGEVSRIMRDDMTLTQVRMPVSHTVFVGIVEAVRNKVLDLALDLEKVAPLAGQSDVSPEDIAPASQVINNHFHGTSNVAIGPAAQIVLELPGPGDHKALLRYLGAAGMPPDQLAELDRTLAEDIAESSHRQRDQRTRWQRTRTWLHRAATDTATGALGGAIATAAGSFLG